MILVDVPVVAFGTDYRKTLHFPLSSILTTMGTGSFPGIKRPGRGAYYPPPHLSAEVMKG